MNRLKCNPFITIVLHCMNSFWKTNIRSELKVQLNNWVQLFKKNHNSKTPACILLHYGSIFSIHFQLLRISWRLHRFLFFNGTGERDSENWNGKWLKNVQNVLNVWVRNIKTKTFNLSNFIIDSLWQYGKHKIGILKIKQYKNE